MDALTIIVFLVKSIMSGVVCINNISVGSLRWKCKGVKVIYLYEMTSIAKSIKDTIKFVSPSIIAFVTKTDLEKGAVYFPYLLQMSK